MFKVWASKEKVTFTNPRKNQHPALLNHMLPDNLRFKAHSCGNEQETLENYVVS